MFEQFFSSSFSFAFFVPLIVGILSFLSYLYYGAEDEVKRQLEEEDKNKKTDASTPEKTAKAEKTPPPTPSTPTGAGEGIRRRKFFASSTSSSVDVLDVDEKKLAEAREMRVEALLLQNRGFTQLRDLKNREAADLFLETYNAKRPDNELDLHELFVDEAERFVKQRVDKLKKNGEFSALKLIIGSNLVGETSVRLHKPMTYFVKDKLGLECADDPKSPGCITVSLGEVKEKKK